MNPHVHSPCVASSLVTGRLSLMNRLGLCEVYISHIQHDTENYSFYNEYKSSVNPGFVKQTTPILLSLYCNGSLAT
jgi:hypothetical protein